MTRFYGAAARSLTLLSVIGLAACQDTPSLHLDPLATDGRTGSAPDLSYAAVMHIANASRSAGDFANAINLYRHAATMDKGNPEPLVALGDTLLAMGKPDEAIVNYNAALKLDAKSQGALRGLAKAYLKTGRPDLAGSPLATAYQAMPNDPKLLLLIGVADDFIGQHGYAQTRYQQGLHYAPGDRSLLVDLALSLALSEKFDQAIATLRPVAYAPAATPQERQTLALIYGLKGDQKSAREIARHDLDAAAVDHNLAFYDTLRRLAPDARSRAILSASAVTRPQS
ncbi:MAG TPA: tetratricopeptide repeat protein [Stellaceae bacterium]|jgi:Flp pilus assembly protein TadD|nr:tetratricopeptide repeat protein [Stellaceae bacterium]